MSFMIYQDTSTFNLTERLVPLYPGAKWETYKPTFDKETEPTLIDVWSERVLKYLDGLPANKKQISSRTLKVSAGANDVAPRTWNRIVDRTCQLSAMDRKDMYFSVDGIYRAILWNREGRSVVRATVERYGLTAA